MSNGKKYNFWDLITAYKIEVPKIQRDYIQGRKTSRVQKNRENFMKNLVDCFKNGKEMSLNFIYGIVENGKLIPIDGQQRLTTLFLLHLYVYARYAKSGSVDKDIFEKFTYSTRYTTQRFLNKLIENREIINKCNNDKLRNEIKNQWWYSASWDDDINVRSCLDVLDDIHNELKDTNNLDSKNLDNITFMFLELDDFGSANELYIKMNSRGKQLTDFENFKAEMYEEVGKSKEFDKFKEEFDKFKNGLEREWAVLVYGICEADYKRISGEQNETLLDLIIKDADSFTKDLFHWIFVNHYYANGWSYFEGENDSLVRTEEEFGTTEKYIEKSGDFWFDTYNTIAPNNSDGINGVISDYYNLFNLLCEIEGSDKTLFGTVCEKMLGVYSTRKKSIVYDPGKMTYDARILLYAVTAYANKNKDIQIDNFKSWFRVILNLVKNTETDKIDKFRDAVQAIKKACEHIADINKVQDKDFIGYFDEIQLEEEKKKLKLINESVDWKQAIYAAEGWYEGKDSGFNPNGVDYFKGQIYFLLYLANDIDQFTNYCKKVFNIFSNQNNDILFHRVMLTYDDYKISKSVNGNVYTFYCYNETHHKYDWRGAFKEQKNKKGEKCWSKAVVCLKKLLEDWNGDEECGKDKEGFEKFANKKTENYTDKDDILIDHLVKNDIDIKVKVKDNKSEKKHIVEYISKYYYVEEVGEGENTDWILMSQKKRNAGSFEKLSKVLKKGRNK